MRDLELHTKIEGVFKKYCMEKTFVQKRYMDNLFFIKLSSINNVLIDLQNLEISNFSLMNLALETADNGKDFYVIFNDNIAQTIMELSEEEPDEMSMMKKKIKAYEKALKWILKEGHHSHSQNIIGVATEALEEFSS